MRTAHSERLAALYLVAQGLGGLIWWVLLLVDSPVRDVFFSSTEGWLAGRTLVFADVVMFGLASIAAGVLSIRPHRFAAPLSWAVVGATAYATLTAFGWLLDPIGSWVGAVAMVAALATTCWAVAVLHGDTFARSAAP